jgi:hypothetical protein
MQEAWIGFRIMRSRWKPIHGVVVSPSHHIEEGQPVDGRSRREAIHFRIPAIRLAQCTHSHDAIDEKRRLISAHR